MRTGHRKTSKGPMAAGAALALLTLLLALALAPQALASPPTHAPAPSLDLTGLNHACGAATDSKGDLYASSAGEGKVKVFDPSHTLLTEVSNPNTPCALAITTTGSLYVSEQATGNVIRYAPSEYPPTASTTYTPTTIDASGNAKGIAVDPKDNRLYVAEGTKVALYKADGGFEANALEGKVGEATGVAAYTYVNTAPAGVSSIYLAVADSEGDVLKLFSAKTGTTAFKARRTVSGVDQDDDPETPDQQFGFGAQGAYLTADPGNESEAHACNQVGGQLCSADHLFLYDAAHEALDELDGYGSLVDQLDTAGLQDAQPTQVAVERSGGAGDGTVYVSSGASTAAKLFAFAPLKEPTREALGEPLSRKLTGAKAVAVDERGDVYVTAEKQIHVYDSEGAALSSFEAPQPRDIAVDGTGHVYVLEGPSAPTFTYYTPSNYPPEASTTYTRHEPPLLPSEAYEAKGTQAVAVNPANDHAFVVGNANFGPAILELAPPSEGSAVLGECGTGLTNLPSRLDIDVNATTGEVYFTTNFNHIYAVRCGSEPEFVRDVSGGGCPSGPFGANPAIAIDQANGHVLQFESGQPGASAREYDGAGGCVAQFGAFSSSPGGYKVAVDNSCALQDPPLHGEACEAFDPAYGNAYVASDSPNAEQPYDLSAFGPLEYVKPGQPPIAATGVADELAAGKATFHGTVNPQGNEVEECAFQYLTQAEYEDAGESFAGAAEEACAETPAQIGAGAEFVDVHAAIEDPVPGVAYCFRAFATNEFGTSDDAEVPSQAFCFGPPAAEARPAQPISYDEATLRGEVNPANAPTKYRFEYLTQAEYEEAGESFATAKSTATKEIAASEGFLAVKAPLTGLTEGTEYRFRLLAENAIGEAEEEGSPFATQQRAPAQECENAAYRTGASSFLPDCRAYELVTPAQTLTQVNTLSHDSGGNFFSSYFVDPRGTGAGESVGFSASVSGGGFGVQRATRGQAPHPAAGWSSEGAGFSYPQSAHSEERHGVAADQRYWLLQIHGVPVATKESFPAGEYLRVPAGTASRQCAPEPKEAFEESDAEAKFELVGCGSQGTDLHAQGRFLSAGGTHVIFTSKAALEEGSPLGSEAIYDREAGSAAAELVSTKPDGSPFEGGEAPSYVAATEDGSTVLFSAAGALYAHRDGQSTEIAAAPSAFAGVSAEGTRVFFIDKAATTPQVPVADLFACDIEAGSGCAGEGAHEPTEIAADSLFVNVSAAGSHAFFTSEAVLTGGEENENEEVAQADEDNLYLWDEGEVSFLAVLDPKDLSGFRFNAGKEGEFAQQNLRQWVNAIQGQSVVSDSSHPGRAASPTRSTPDGGALLFQSHAQLTAYENEGHGEIYRYAPAASPKLSCVSCDPSGVPPPATSFDTFLQLFAGNQGGFTNWDTLIPNVTDDGTHVFFQSPSPLLPEDANQVSDVYEWRAPGIVGAGGDECMRPEGCLALISSGQGNSTSALYGMSADGKDVFFETREKLAGADTLDSFSIYDARELGGIPYAPEPEACQGDACQPLGSSSPALASPTTTGGGEEGAPEASRKPCVKGKHRVKGRCVQRKHRKRAHKHRANRDGRAHR